MGSEEQTIRLLVDSSPRVAALHGGCARLAFSVSCIEPGLMETALHPDFR